jgi:hypothetical protein
VQEEARTLSHGDEFLTKLLLDAWHHHMSVEDYISLLMRPQNPGPYLRRIKTLGNEVAAMRYYHARPPQVEEAGSRRQQAVSTRQRAAGKDTGGRAQGTSPAGPRARSESSPSRLATRDSRLSTPIP